MGKLLPRHGNVTFSGAGELSPLTNDPQYRTIGIGTRIFLGGATGFITGAGTQHNPQGQLGTVMVQGDLKKMSAEFLRAASFPAYGTSLYVGLGVPIPVLNARIAESTGVGDADITTEIRDYGVASRQRPVLGTVNYAELKSGSVRLGGRNVPTASLSSFSGARTVAETLKRWIERGEFELSTPVEPLARTATVGPLEIKGASAEDVGPSRPTTPSADALVWDEAKCVQCGLCVSLCPRGVFRRNADWTIRVDAGACRPCGRCRDACPVQSIQTPRGAKR
jgi:ferredoxin